MGFFRRFHFRWSFDIIFPFKVELRDDHHHTAQRHPQLTQVEWRATVSSGLERKGFTTQNPPLFSLSSTIVFQLPPLLVLGLLLVSLFPPLFLRSTYSVFFFSYSPYSPRTSLQQANDVNVDDKEIAPPINA